jgi:glycosyltransferase involved in cell wall biosynthesis
MEMGKKKMKISVIVIAKDEEEVIGRCLESVGWADEIIVLDTGSTDKTVETAQKLGAKVFKYPDGDETDYSAWRNYGLRQAQGEWVLYLDADERVTPLLKKEIESIINRRPLANSEFAAYAIPRRNIRLGREMKHGGWWPDYVLRLIRKGRLQRWEGQLHEQPIIKGEVGRLKEALVHFSHRGSFEHKVANTIVWSKLEAALLFKANHPPMTVKRFFGAMAREFYQRMIKHQAWRDGAEGVIEAIYQVFSVFITYARLWEMQQKNESRNY